MALVERFRVTSSTAQGGGGSFRNRKPRRGWLLWITDGRAKPLMDRQVVEVSSLSLFFSLFLSLFLTIYLRTYLPIYLSTYLPTYLSIYLPIYPSIYLIIYLSIYASLKTKLFCETSSIFELNNVKNEAILRHFFIFWTRQHPKRSNFVRPIQFLNLTTSKTKQFCETSFKNRKLSAALTASYQCVLRLFHSTCLKNCTCHEKLMPGHTECCTCHAKSS